VEPKAVHSEVDWQHKERAARREIRGLLERWFDDELDALLQRRSAAAERPRAELPAAAAGVSAAPSRGVSFRGSAVARGSGVARASRPPGPSASLADAQGKAP
jgi:hypothetical protein